MKAALVALSLSNLVLILALTVPSLLESAGTVEAPPLNEIEQGDRYYYGAEVLRVIDGDTIEARIDLGFDTFRVETLRLYGIDAPEMKLAERPEGERSKQWLISQIGEGGETAIRTIKDETGSFGRYLAVVFYEGRNLNQEMLDLNLAVPYSK